MNKRPALIILTICMAIVAFFFGDAQLSYQTNTELGGFPIPKNARVERQTETVTGYEWDRASFENGIPFSYQMAIKQHGWTMAEREGGNTRYTKGNVNINLLSDTDYIEITKER